MFKRADLYKMHAYCDAIPNARSVWILYPGSELRFFSEDGSSVLGQTIACQKYYGSRRLPCCLVTPATSASRKSWPAYSARSILTARYRPPRVPPLANTMHCVDADTQLYRVWPAVWLRLFAKTLVCISGVVCGLSSHRRHLCFRATRYRAETATGDRPSTEAPR